MTRIIEDLFCRTSHTRCRSVCLDTTLLTATAETSVTAMIDLAVTQLTGKTVMTIEQLTIYHDTRTDTCTERISGSG